MILIPLALIVFIGVFFFLNHRDKKNAFKKAYEEFNLHRINPLTEEQFKSYYDFQNMIIPFPFIHRIDLKSTNHRNGDEIVTSHRDAAKRLEDHLNLRSSKNTISSLGYDFTSRENFFKFISILGSTMRENSTRSFPVNSEWFIISKTSTGLGVSFKATSV